MAADIDFSQRLLVMTQAILDAARAADWERLNELTDQREQLINTDAGQQKPTPGTEAIWRQVDSLNREALALTENQLGQLGQGVQSAHNEQRLQKRYGS